MKILNLYAGVGGNRKLWGDSHQITAIEFNQDIAKVYKYFYPSDNVVVADAHLFLLQHYKDFDFIWSSPPCPTHSCIRRCGVKKGQYDAKFPDMKLYEEIIFLNNFFDGIFVVENVKPYYEPLIQAVERGRHLFWSNFFIPEFNIFDNRTHNEITGGSCVYGISLKDFNINDKRKILRNMVDPKLAEHVLNNAIITHNNKNNRNNRKKMIDGFIISEQVIQMSLL
jgi:DNA (cytosine-5)-methyltransferase 1